ncbi:MAG: hypothetical protein K1X89_17330 [Myxococcaceae bacterium]|nr:hypothetical protein [Myxococcaceae bacterium]
MHRLVLPALGAIVVCWSTVAGAAEPGEVVITTRDGKQHVGKVLNELQRGYLLKTSSGTEVIDFSDVEDFAQVGAPRASTAAAAPAARSGEVERPWLEARRGFRPGLGIGTLTLPGPNGRSSRLSIATAVLLQLPLEYCFGRFALRATPTLGVQLTNLISGSRLEPLFVAGLDLQFRLSLAEHFGVGLGVYQGGFVGQILTYGGGPSLTLVDVRFGATDQHELSLWASLPFWTAGGIGAPLGALSYSYLF